jgi:hypothetical protein
MPVTTIWNKYPSFNASDESQTSVEAAISCYQDARVGWEYVSFCLYVDLRAAFVHAMACVLSQQQKDKRE